MSHLIRVLFALQICILFVAGCAVDDDSAADTELTVDSEVADLATSEEVATPDVPEAALEGTTTVESVTAQASCQSFRMTNRDTFGTCRSLCSSRGMIGQSFNNSSKICRCCTVGPF